MYIIILYMIEKEFSKETIKFCQNISKKQKQKLGKYPTPYSIIRKLYDKIPFQNWDDKDFNILEPSHGTGQILDINSDREICYTNFYACELDENLSKKCQKIYNNVQFIQGDFLEQKFDIKFDFIPANPPYFEIKDKNSKKKYKSDKQFKDILCGKINIFCLFLKKCLDLLRDDGYLSFIIPVSFLNGRNYELLRKYIVNNFDIIDIEIIDSHKFIDTQIEVMIITIKKTKNTGKYIVKHENALIFSLNWIKVQHKLNNYKNISELGGEVHTGKLIWNENKEHLRAQQTENVIPIIYSENIVNGIIKLKPIDKSNGKKQYILKSIIQNKIETKPAIVINRIIGSKNIKINCALVKNMKFIGENHVNIITHNDEKVLEEILKILKNQETLNFIKTIRGNIQLSQSDLKYLIPIRKKK